MLISYRVSLPNVRQINHSMFALIDYSVSLVSIMKMLNVVSHVSHEHNFSFIIVAVFRSASIIYARSEKPVHRSKSECTAPTEIVMPCFTFYATEGAPPPNTAVLFTGGNGTS